MLCYLGLGSNVGNKSANISHAIQLINESKLCNVLKVSNFYVTAPYGVLNQDSFVNGAISVDTTLSPIDLLHFVKSIEVIVGRQKRDRWGPREIDIDILFYGSEVIESDELTIPHKDMLNRSFVIRPLLDIERAIIHPALHKSVFEIAEENNLDLNLPLYK